MLAEAIAAAGLGEDVADEPCASPLELPGLEEAGPRTPRCCLHVQRRLFSPLEVVEGEDSLKDDGLHHRVHALASPPGSLGPHRISELLLRSSRLPEEQQDFSFAERTIDDDEEMVQEDRLQASEHVRSRKIAKPQSQCVTYRAGRRSGRHDVFAIAAEDEYEPDVLEMYGAMDDTEEEEEMLPAVSEAEEEPADGNAGLLEIDCEDCDDVCDSDDVEEEEEIEDDEVGVEELCNLDGGALCPECGMDFEECSCGTSSLALHEMGSLSDVHAALEAHVVCWPAPTALDLEDHLSRAPDIRIFWFMDVRDRMYTAAMLANWEQSAVPLEPIHEYPQNWPQWRINSFELREACRAGRAAAAAVSNSAAHGIGNRKRARSAHAVLCPG